MERYKVSRVFFGEMGAMKDARIRKRIIGNSAEWGGIPSMEFSGLYHDASWKSKEIAVRTHLGAVALRNSN
jgi:hypothetical protein